MIKKYTIKIESTEDYISIYNGIFNLSDTEIEILAAFIDLYVSLKKASVNINPFSTEMKKKVAHKLGRDDFNTLNNYIKKLREKKAITPSVDGYDIHSMLIPMDEEAIMFKLNYTNE